MGLKDKVAEQEAKRKPITKAQEEKKKPQEAIEKIVKARNTGAVLTKDDAQFIIAKLRQAEYKGSEFEQFYTIMQKLQKFL